MRTQYRFTPQVRKTPFIVMNFLLQKEDKSETKYTCDKGEKKAWFLIFAGDVFIHFPQVSGIEPEYHCQRLCNVR